MDIIIKTIFEIPKLTVKEKDIITDLLLKYDDEEKMTIEDFLTLKSIKKAHQYDWLD